MLFGIDRSIVPGKFVTGKLRTVLLPQVYVYLPNIFRIRMNSCIRTLWFCQMIESYAKYFYSLFNTCTAVLQAINLLLIWMFRAVSPLPFLSNNSFFPSEQWKFATFWPEARNSVVIFFFVTIWFLWILPSGIKVNLILMIYMLFLRFIELEFRFMWIISNNTLRL